MDESGQTWSAAVRETYDKLEAEAAIQEDEAEANDLALDRETEQLDETPEVEAEDTEEAEEDEVSEIEASESEDTEEDEPEDDSGTVIDPPKTWTKENQEAFLALPREQQEYIAERERQREEYLAEQSKQTAALKQQFDPISQVLKPYEEQMRLAGVNPAQAVNQLLAAQDYLNKDPVNAILWLAQSYGVDPTSLVPNEDHDLADPEVLQLQRELQQVKSHLYNQNLQTQQATQKQVHEQIDHFVNETDEQGNPSHPHFQEVYQHMVALMQGGAANDLQDAYDQAVMANPKTRAMVIEAKQKEVLEAEKQKRIAAANRAKKSKKVRSANVSTTQTKPRTLRETLEANWEAAS